MRCTVGETRINSDGTISVCAMDGPWLTLSAADREFLDRRSDDTYTVYGVARWRPFALVIHGCKGPEAAALVAGTAKQDEGQSPVILVAVLPGERSTALPSDGVRFFQPDA